MKQRADLTFKYNREKGRHGWLRLTPAYSINAALQFLDRSHHSARILDPFCGTGTTGLLCSELGVEAVSVELNPFLVWFATVKSHHYTEKELITAEKLARDIVNQAKTNTGENPWTPPIKDITRWWLPKYLHVLAEIFEHIRRQEKENPTASVNLLKIGFCQLIIQWSNAAFNHQSMSFKAASNQLLFELDHRDEILTSFGVIARKIVEAAHFPLLSTSTIIQGDSRHIAQLVEGHFTQVITSPPYPNRMSYIRELRPYMYWLGYINEAREAGELDWQAIGGTWGIATSRLTDWTPGSEMIDHPDFYDLLHAIADSPNSHSTTLANYVHRYFLDMTQHFLSLKTVLRPGAELVYVVGNSKFYNVVVPVEQIYASIMKQIGFSDISVEILRKRSSKKELYEYAVIARA